MKTASLALLALTCVFGSAAASAAPASAPPSEILALAQRVIDAANANDDAEFTGLYTADAVVIDESAPFRWTGADAGMKWWQHVQRTLAAGQATLHATLSTPTEYRLDHEGDDAYLIEPVTVSVTSGGKTRAEHGTQTYTFHKANGTWKISSATWTTTPQ